MEKTAVNVRLYLTISSVLALAASAAGCGGSSGDRGTTGGVIDTGGTPASTGGVIETGGTPAIGGTPVTGGTPATGGTTGAAGATVTPTVLACNPGIQPAAPLLTDFSATAAGWHAGAGKWGTAGNLTGSGFNYASTGSTMNWKVDTVAENFVLYGNVMAPGGYGGGGMSFDQCVNTAVYTGVQFTLGGTPAGCALKLQVQTYSQQAVANGGGCVANCYGFPSETLASTTGSVVVKFADLAGTGQPATAAAIAQELIGLQWQFESPPPVGDAGQPDCLGINLTIDDVSFVSN
jgi:hypothetical protein